MLWSVFIDQGVNRRLQDRIVQISVNHDSFMQSFSIKIENPTWIERSQARGRIDNAIIQIKRGDEVLIDGFIENVEGGADHVTYSGRSFLILLGYSTSSETESGGSTKAEYSNKTGSYIIDDLIDNFCVTKDAELTYTDITFTEIYGGIVKLHGKKVYQIVKEMCSSHGKDLWSDGTLISNDITNKNIHIGTKSRGSSGSPHKTLRGGQHLKDIPVIKYKTGAEMMNCLRVIGKGEGKDQISVWCEDETAAPNNSIINYGYIEGQPYRSNMISKESTATSIGNAIIAAKKDPITQLNIDPAYYISDLKYGDWVNIIDDHSNIDTVKRIKKIVYIYNINQNDSMQIELGDQFNNYENIINDLTKGDVDPEKEMTLGGGSFRITPNTPPNTYVRIDKGSWYGTNGVFYKFSTDSVRVFWGGEPPYNATVVNNYFKALIQIKDNAVSSSDIEYKTSLTVGAHTGYNQATAEGESISPDTGYTPLGEIILKCDNISGTVYDVEATDEGGSYIWRDVRPIIGSSATGFGGEGLWENIGSPEYTRLILAQEIDLQDKILHFHKSISNMRIYRSGDNLIINPASTASSIGIGGILSADYGISNCDGITMYDSGSNLDMNYAEIIDSGDVTLYDNTTLSPKLTLKVPVIESAGGAYLVANDNNFWINAIGGSVLAKCIIDTKKWEIGGDLSVIGDIDLSVSNITGITYLKSYYSTGLDIKNSAGTSMITLGDATYGAKLLADIDMNHNDIIDCKNIKGDTTGTNGADRLNLDFRGDGNHRIYYTGASDNKMKYDTITEHILSIGGTMIGAFNTNGLTINAGKYIKSQSGDLELRAPSGSKIKFVIG